jgi:uncharacterized cupin superfamily protein
MSVPEATVVQTEHGDEPEGDGWFVLNAATSRWLKDGNGEWCVFVGAERQGESFNAHLVRLAPGVASSKYHAEDVQEGFLVLEGECLAIVEEEERALRRWDYLHCPPGTFHTFVGAGDGPCTVLMMGARGGVHYPVSEVAARYDASVPAATDEPDEAYADWDRKRSFIRSPLDG